MLRSGIAALTPNHSSSSTSSQRASSPSNEGRLYLRPLPTTLIRDLPYAVHEGPAALSRRLPELASYIYVEAAAAAA